MKKIFLLTALLVAGFVASATAQSKSFSVGLSLGLKGDQAGLGSVIMNDGGLPIKQNTLAGALYNSADLIMPGNENMFMEYSSNNTNTAFDVTNGQENGGALTGLEIGLLGTYEFNNMGLPLFARVGFNYMFRLMGGQMSRTFGDVTNKYPGLAALLASEGITNPAGGTIKSDITASHLEIPLTFGININLDSEGKYKLYAGIGVSYFSGGWGVKFDIDSKAVSALTNYIDMDAMTATNNGITGAVTQEVWFKYSGFGVNYMVGTSAQIATDVHLFLELAASGTAGISYSDELDDSTSRVATAAMGGSTLYNADPHWFKRIAYPVQLAGATVKFGAKYFVF